MNNTLHFPYDTLWQKAKLMVNDFWYQKPMPFWGLLLLPFSLIYLLIIKIRLSFYQIGIKSSNFFPLPTIIVGNLTVGGTGKTPLVIHIVNLLKERGYRVGIISRNYKGSLTAPTWVTSESNPKQVGDEPVLLAKKLNCPMIVAKKRTAAMQALVHSKLVDVVISDDGLQHYALGRHIEIAVVDGKRRFGNGFCLPLGPLREPPYRLNSVDLIVSNGGVPTPTEYDMLVKAKYFYNTQTSETVTLDFFKHQTVHAIAGIGNPDRFFKLLEEQEIKVIPHRFPDHHFFKQNEIEFSDDFPVIMTEKDSVKCKEFINKNHWVLVIEAVLSPLFDARLLVLLQEIKYG